MGNEDITEKDREMAEFCKNCPVCNRARNNQQSLANWFVRRIESKFCPYCQAYERVYGKKPHEPVSS